VESTFRFAVGTAITATSTSDTGAGTSWPPAGLRWLLFAGFALAHGGTVGARITDAARQLRPSLPPVAGLIRVGAAAGLVAAAVLAVLVVSDAGWAALVGSTPGQVLVVEAAVFAVALGLLATRLRGWAWLPLLAVAAAEGIRAHPGQAVPG